MKLVQRPRLGLALARHWFCRSNSSCATLCAARGSLHMACSAATACSLPLLLTASRTRPHQCEHRARLARHRPVPGLRRASDFATLPAFPDDAHDRCLKSASTASWWAALVCASSSAAQSAATARAAAPEMCSSLCCKSGRCACHTRSEAAAVSQCSLPRHRLPASPTPSTAMATPLARRGSRPRAAVQQHRAAASARHGGAARGEAGGGAACGAGPSHGRERGRADGGAVGDGGAGDGVPRMWGRSTDTARQARRASQAMQIGRFCCCYIF
ncbi:hypothetical protein ACP70R_032304 [Stipagrostis hirtigluma subsp. patula]